MAEQSNRPSICIVAHNAYGVLANVDTGHAGGIEVQTPLLAKWLAKQGWRVSMITWDEGYEDGVEIDGVRVYKLCRKDAGLPVARFFVPRWSSLIGALNRANADVVYYNCGDLGLGQVALWAKWKRRKVVYSVAGNAGCHAHLPELKAWRERVLYKYGLFRADDIIAQTNVQKDLLAEGFGIEATVIRMPSAGFEGNLERRPPSDPLRVLWVGRIDKIKRIEWLLDVAEMRPEIIFDVVGDSNAESSYAREQFQRAERLNNVNLHGRVAHEQMGQYYAAADLLCSTSIMEGFPNVYLEAWSTGLPLVTTFDPDGVVAQHGHGKVAASPEALAEALDNFAEAEQWQAASQAARNYFQRYHAVDITMAQFKARFAALVN